MSEQSNDNSFKEKFRPAEDPNLEDQVNAAMADISLDQLYSAGPQAGAEAPAAPPSGVLRGVHKGRVVSVSADDVFIDLGAKNQGTAPRSQFEEANVGDEVEVNVEKFDVREGLYQLSKKGALATSVSWDSIDTGQVVEGTVTGMNKGGLEVQVKGLRGFMPSGQVDINFMQDISSLIGQRVTAEVQRVDRDKKNLILSRRAVLEREREQARERLMTDLAVGQVRRGTVRNVMDFGAFVDLGGVDGLLHVSEMSHRRVKSASEVLKVGDVVDVKVTKLDPETGRLSLSLKQAMADPWVDAATRYAVGAAATGRVARIESFGAFIEVEEGIEGLLPVSEMSWQRIRHPADVVKVGETVRLLVLSIDPPAHRLSFSLKQAGPDPWSMAEANYPVHSIATAKVTRTVDFGAFCELEPGVEGLVHISELSNNRVRTVGDVVKAGDEVKVRVLEFDGAKRRISLSIKRAAEDAPAPVPEVAAAPVPAGKKKKRPELRGGLDF